jgi:non-ribosomal peptide synthetase component F
VAGALAHQDLPFERLVAELGRARQRDTHPVFQVVFAFQDAPDPQWSLPGVDVQAWEPDNGTAKFDLTLSLTDMGDSMSGWVEYRADRFAPATVKGWVDELLALLADVVADPEGIVAVEPLRDTDDEREEFRWPSS